MMGQWVFPQAAHLLLGSSRCAKMAAWRPFIISCLPSFQYLKGQVKFQGLHPACGTIQSHSSPMSSFHFPVRPWQQPCLGHPIPCPRFSHPPNTPGAEYTNLVLLSCPHSTSACPATPTRKPCTNCWPSTGTSKHPTWSFQWLVVPKTSPWSHACARSSAGWFTSHSLKVY